MSADFATVTSRDGGWSRASSFESSYHRQGEGNFGHTKYIHANGSEAVFDGETLVTDDLNMGTFNFVVPGGGWKNPILWIASRAGHTALDVLPYWLWGNTEKDPSSALDRTVGAPAVNTWREINGFLDAVRAGGGTVTVRP